MNALRGIDKIVKIIKLLAEVLPVDLKRMEGVLSTLASIAYKEDGATCNVFYARIELGEASAKGIVVVRRGTPALSGARHNELLNAFFCAMRMAYPTLTGCTLVFEEGHV